MMIETCFLYEILSVRSIRHYNRKFYEGRSPEVELRLHEEVKAKCDSVCKAQIFLSNPKFRAI